jgi:hypothetical protein
MFRKIMCFAVFAALVVPVFAGNPDGAAMDKKAAYALLDGIGQMFHQMAMTGTGGVEKLEKGIQQFMADAKKAKDQNQINPVFYRRYARLLAIIKLVMAPDPGGILSPIIDRELGQFVGVVLGEEWKGGGKAGSIGLVANAIAEEIIDLQMYMDNLEVREKLRKAWDEKFNDAAPVKKDGFPAPAAK